MDMVELLFIIIDYHKCGYRAAYQKDQSLVYFDNNSYVLVIFQ
jgi:hypothetical protein